MSGFAPTGTSATGLDPRKRVNYRLGLVLGEDEFRQDQLHHRERDDHAVRALHGYGTVSGLAVRYDAETRRLHVQPGLAVDPAGRLVCVPVEYCASLEGWLADHLADHLEDGGVSGPPPSLPVYVVLCWAQCETDEVPIPVDACLSEEDSRAASRLMDSFELRLTVEPPPVVGEAAPGSPGDLRDLVEELHALDDVSGGSFPDPDAVARLLRDWAVERRPEVAAGRACLPAPEADADACVLLAAVDVDIAEGPGGIAVTGATVDDAARPVLVSTRLLQEALLTRIPSQGAPGGGPGVDDHGDLAGLDGDDHPQYLLADGTRPLAGDLRAAGNRLLDVPPSAGDGQPVVHGQGAGGDLGGRYPDPLLAAVQGTPVDAPSPAERDTLLLREGRWAAGRPWVLPLVTVQRLPQQARYAVWFHLDAPENRAEVAALDEEGLVVHRETEQGSFLRRVGPGEVNRVTRNVFFVELREESALLRFTFTLDRIRTADGASVQEWAERTGLWFLGQSGERGETVTAFSVLADRLG